MFRRRAFDPATVPESFWEQDLVQAYLASRMVGNVVHAYLAAFPECSQKQMARLVRHRRSDGPRWVRGWLSEPVSDVGVLTRVADGLRMPDSARVLLGVVPRGVLVRSALSRGAAREDASPVVWAKGVRLALCGGRGDGVPDEVMDRAVRALAGTVAWRCAIVHDRDACVGGELMAYIAGHHLAHDARDPDRLPVMDPHHLDRPAVLEPARPAGPGGPAVDQPPSPLPTAGALNGCPHLFCARRGDMVWDAEVVIVVGGGQRAVDQVNVALALGRQVVAVPGTGGAADRLFELARRDPAGYGGLSGEQVAALDACRDVEDAVRVIHRLLTGCEPVAPLLPLSWSYVRSMVDALPSNRTRWMREGREPPADWWPR